MPRLSVMGHPVHPIAQAISAAVLPASTTFDAPSYVMGDEEGFSKAGHYTLIFGLAGGAVSAATGVLGYYEIHNRPVRRTALYHGLSNVALMASYSASLLLRRNGRADLGALSLSALGASPEPRSAAIQLDCVHDRLAEHRAAVERAFRFVSCRSVPAHKRLHTIRYQARTVRHPRLHRPRPYARAAGHRLGRGGG